MDYSILIPVYRAEKYIEESIRSALDQTGDFSYEILLVEDGSPDKSGQICDTLCRQYPDRIRVIHRPHEGTVATRRHAISQAQGDFILWLDSDDILSSDCLSGLEAFRQAYPQADIILYEMSFFHEDEGRIERRPPLSPRPDLLEGARKKELYALLIEGNRLDSLCTKAIRRNLLQEDPSDYTPCASNPYGEDVLHSLYPFTHARQILMVPQEWYQYRIHSESVMHVWDEDRLQQRLNTAKWDFFLPFMESWGMADQPWQDKLHANGYKAVLDGMLHFWQQGDNRNALQSFMKRFAAAHPEIRTLSRSPYISRKLRFQLHFMVQGRLRPILLALKLYQMTKKR